MKNSLALCLVFLAVTGLAGEKHWRGTSSDKASVAANWAEGAVPADGDDIILDADSANKNLTWDINAAPASWTQSGYTGTVTFMTGSAGVTAEPTYGAVDGSGIKYLYVTGAVDLQSGTWTHLANSRNVPTDGNGRYRLWVTADGAFTLGANATIDVQGKGYGYDMGPGRISGTSSGASHGGRGSTSAASIVGPACYGSFREPITLGTGGTSSAYGSRGGGAVKIIAGGLLTVNGTINADAGTTRDGTSTACQYYGGSGGAIFLKGATVAGTGTLKARGGYASSYGEGGGGRIAVHVTASDDLSSFTPTLSVRGYTKGDRYSAGATYYVETKSDAGHGTLTAHGAEGVTTSTRYTYSDITAADGAAHVKSLVLDGGVIVSTLTGGSLTVDAVSQTPADSVNALCLLGGTLTVPSGFEWTDVRLYVRDAGSTLAYTSANKTLTLNGATAFFDVPFSLPADLVLKNGAKITHTENDASRVYYLDLTVAGNLSVDSTSSIDATGKGYNTGKGPGHSTLAVNLKSGSHGGKGYAPGEAVCYGSVRHPVTMGSGGSWNSPIAYGGGTIKLTVLGATTLNGKITSAGGTTEHYPGAGGSTWLITGSLSGSGSIDADGGVRTSYTTPCGAGGRVSVQLTDANATFANFTDATNGAIHAWAAKVGSSRNGGGGTVYLQTGAQEDGEGLLIIENPDGGDYMTEFGADVTDTDVGDVVIRKGGHLSVLANQTFAIVGSLILEGGTAAFASSAVLELTDATRTCSLAGGLTIPNLLCEVPGKRIEFAADSTTTIADGGSITLTGSAESPIVLAPSPSSGTWTLALGAGVAQTMEYLAVTNSIATGGATALNSFGSNVNGWTFKNVVVGETITWTGAASDNWSDVGNWDLGRAPVKTDVVAIPAEKPNSPKLYGEVEIWKLQIASGTELQLNGNNLIATSDVTAQGAITASDTETLTVGGNVTFASGGLNVARATLVLNGTSQTVDLGGRNYWSIECSEATTPTFTSSFRTRYFISRVDAAQTITFAAATTASVDELILQGEVSGAAALTVASDAASSVFKLAVSNRADVKGVNFTDCDATDGMTVYAFAPSSATRSDGIIAGGVRKVWKAGTTGNFNVAGNWVDGVAPTAEDSVLIDGGGTVTVSADATVRELIVGGSAATTLKLTKALTVTGSALLSDQATVTANAAFGVTNALILEAGSVLTHDSGGSYRAVVNVGGNCAFDLGATINLYARGYAYNSGPGRSTIGSTSASHGGRGTGTDDKSKQHIGGNGACYDSIHAPSQCGSGGTDWTTSSGGGAVYLGVVGTLALNGTINANANLTEYYAGSGGAVHIEAGRLTGAGKVSANGGIVTAGQYLAAGGGGRIAITLTKPASDFSSFTGSVTAYGGSQQSESWKTGSCAGAGTVYLRTGAQAANEGTLIIDNGPDPYRKTCECRIAAETLGKDVGSVVIAKDTRLTIAENQTFDFRRDWTNNGGSLLCETGSTVNWLTAAAGTMSGTNGFYNFSCTVPGKTLTFSAADSILSFLAGGTLTLTGEEGNLLTLVSSVPGAWWTVQADPSVNQTMQYLDVTDSYARDGATMVAMDSAGEGQHNDNWNFVNVVKGETNTWTGTASSSWTDAGNWELGRAPSETDIIVIPQTSRGPVLNAAAAVWEVTVAAGASFYLAGYNLTLSNLTVNGSLFAGSELGDGAQPTVTVIKDAAFGAGSTFDAGRSTILFTGDGTQSLTASGKSFYNLTVEKNGGTLTFADGFAANRLNVSASAAVGVTFAAGKTYTVDQVKFLGRVGDAAQLTLASGTTYQSWTINARNLAFADGVTVSDSVASGLTFQVPSPSTGERCTGWTFGVAEHAWTGEVDNLYTNEQNWAGGAVPGATDPVWIRSAQKVLIDSPVTVGDLYLGGDGLAVTCQVSDVLSVAGVIEVGAGAVLIANTNVTAGAVIVRNGGLVTHLANGPSERYRVDLTVTRDVEVEVGGSIDVKGMGYGKGKGPGYIYNAPSHGGQGCTGDLSKIGPCYGSILNPLRSGSGGTLYEGFGAPGGGVVRLVVGGRLIVDGVLSADGKDDIVKQAETYEWGYYSGAGGSLNLTCATIAGTGRISSNGGLDKHSLVGAGGRIALRLTAAEFSGFTGQFECYGGHYYDPLVAYKPRSSSGTIYLQTANQAEGSGTVTLANGGRTEGVEYGVTYPVGIDGDTMKALAKATFEIKDGAAMILTEDCTVGELEIEGSYSRLYLKGHTLTVRSRKHASSTDPKGYKGYPVGTVIPGDGGRIFFPPRPLAIILR